MNSTRRLRTVLTTVICAAVLQGGGLSQASAIVSYNRDRDAFPWLEPEEATTAIFTSTGGLTGFESPVPSNSFNDLAQGISPVLLSGTPHGVSGPISVLTDGTLGPNQGDTGTAFFFQDADDGGTIRLTLASVARIGQINTYSWADTIRGPQKYQVYAAGALAGNALAAVPTDAINILTNYTLIATVDATQPNGNAGGTDWGQWGVSINPGATLGDYQNFMFVIQDAARVEGNANDFWREIDIVAAVPEPSTILLLGVGGLLLWRKRSKTRPPFILKVGNL